MAQNFRRPSIQIRYPIRRPFIELRLTRPADVRNKLYGASLTGAPIRVVSVYLIDLEVRDQMRETCFFGAELSKPSNSTGRCKKESMRRFPDLCAISGLSLSYPIPILRLSKCPDESGNRFGLIMGAGARISRTSLPRFAKQHGARKVITPL
jgi:hypothetical protein